jgi:hypothetical protein
MRLSGRGDIKYVARKCDITEYQTPSLGKNRDTPTHGFKLISK